jgi:hypothetical protein
VSISPKRSLLLPARGEKVGMRGRFCSAQNGGKAPHPLASLATPARRRGERIKPPADNRNRSRDALMRPSCANHDHAKKDSPPKREAERRKAHANHVRVCADKCTQSAPLIRYAAARPFGGHARLSALTLAALATGYHPDGSAPEPGFPKTDLTGVLPAWPACLRLSTLRADRSFCRSTGDPEPPGTKADS